MRARGWPDEWAFGGRGGRSGTWRKSGPHKLWGVVLRHHRMVPRYLYCVSRRHGVPFRRMMCWVPAYWGAMDA